ncbi:zinc finger CCCH domain-containing protein 13-like, partial [Heptranchias perlo]
MEKDQCTEICHEKIDERKNELKEREKEKDKDRDREKERRRNKHKESRKAERREGREKEERRANGEEVRIDKKEDETKRKDHEGHIMDQGNAVVIVQTPLNCHEDNLITKEEKPGKTIKSVSTHNTRGATADLESKGRSRDDKYSGGQTQPRDERDSKGGGEKILERTEKVSLSSMHPETRHGVSENHRPVSVERESWGDPYISPSSRRPKYSYRANMDKGEEEVNKHHHEKHYCPSSESLTEPSCRIAHIIHSNISNPEPKVSPSKHRSSDKPPRPESKDPSRKRAENRLSPNVHLYMSELVPHPFETKTQTPNSPADSRAAVEHGKRKSRRTSKDENANGGSTQVVRATDEDTLNGRDDRLGKTVKLSTESPRDTAFDTESKGRSRDDKYPGGQTHSRGERDSKGGGEKILEWSEKVSLSSTHPEMRYGVSENHRPFSVERESWGDPYISPSSQRPKYSYRANMDKGEEIRYGPDKYSGSHCTPAEPNLRACQKMEYTVISNITSPEVKRKHIKHKSVAKEHLNTELAVKGLHNTQPAAQAKSDATAGQVLSGPTDSPLAPEYPVRKTRKSSREKSSATINALETWNSPESLSTVAKETDGYGQGCLTTGGLKSLEGWGRGFTSETQFEAKHEDWFPESKDGLPSAEKKETYQGPRALNSRRPRYSYGTNVDMEDDSIHLLNKNVSRVSVEPVLRITNKSEYMVSSTSTSPETNRKLIKYSNSLEEQPPTLSNFINKAKQLEIATTMQPISAYGSPTMPCPLSSANVTKDNQQAAYNGQDCGGSAFMYKNSVIGGHLELSSTNSQDRPHGEYQRGGYCKPYLLDLPDGDTDRDRRETATGDIKLMASHSSTSLRQRAVSSLGMTLTDGTLCVDIPRPIVSASRKNLIGTIPYNTEIVSNKLRSKPGHFKHQYQECQKRSLQTRKRYQEEVNAALMIQAAWKGYQTRTEIRKQAEAAVIIQ